MREGWSYQVRATVAFARRRDVPAELTRPFLVNSSSLDIRYSYVSQSASDITVTLRLV